MASLGRRATRYCASALAGPFASVGTATGGSFYSTASRRDALLLRGLCSNVSGNSAQRPRLRRRRSRPPDPAQYNFESNNQVGSPVEPYFERRARLWAAFGGQSSLAVNMKATVADSQFVSVPHPPLRRRHGNFHIWVRSDAN